MDWKQYAVDLLLNQNKTWKETVLGVQANFFPDDKYENLYDKVRSYVRKTPRYKAKHKTENSRQGCSVSYKNGETTYGNKFFEIMSGKTITPEIACQFYNIDINLFDITSFSANFWQSQIKGGKKIDLYQIKLTVKPKKQEITIPQLKEHFDKFKATYKPQPHKYVDNKSDLMLEVNISDLHFGKLCHNAVSGENFDYKIARERFFRIIDAECDRAEQTQFEKILFVWTNDFFNADGMEETTSSGTHVQECDVRWQKMFTKGVEMLVEAIDRLSAYAPVETFYIASNHARQVEFYAINYLSAWFRNYDNVIVNVNSKARYYYLYGINLIGFSHSYYESKKNQPFLMSVEVPDLWAKAKYREMHLAHYHCEKVEEIGGVIYRWLPTVTGTDTWHYDSGYIGAFKRSYSFVWDKEYGLTTINVTMI